jgi:hypothetical protein
MVSAGFSRFQPVSAGFSIQSGFFFNNGARQRDVVITRLLYEHCNSIIQL